MRASTVSPPPKKDHPIESPYLTTREATAYLKISEPTVHRWVKEGILKPRRLPGGNLRFRRSDLDDVLG